MVCGSVTPASVAAAPDVRDKVTDENSNPNPLNPNPNPNANVTPYPNGNANPKVTDESMTLSNLNANSNPNPNPNANVTLTLTQTLTLTLRLVHGPHIRSPKPGPAAVSRPLPLLLPQMFALRSSTKAYPKPSVP